MANNTNEQAQKQPFIQSKLLKVVFWLVVILGVPTAALTASMVGDSGFDGFAAAILFLVSGGYMSAEGFWFTIGSLAPLPAILIGKWLQSTYSLKPAVSLVPFEIAGLAVAAYTLNALFN